MGTARRPRRSEGSRGGLAWADLRGIRRKSCRTRGGRRGRGARTWPRRWPTRAPAARHPCATPTASPPPPPSAPLPRHRRLRPNPQIRTGKRSLRQIGWVGSVQCLPLLRLAIAPAASAAAAPVRGGGDLGSDWFPASTSSQAHEMQCLDTCTRQRARLRRCERFPRACLRSNVEIGRPR